MSSCWWSIESDVTKSFDALTAHHTMDKPVETVPISPLKWKRNQEDKSHFCSLSLPWSLVDVSLLTESWLKHLFPITPPSVRDSILKRKWQRPMWHYMLPLMRGDSRMPNIQALRCRKCMKMSLFPTVKEEKGGEDWWGRWTVTCISKWGLPTWSATTLIIGKPQMRHFFVSDMTSTRMEEVLKLTSRRKPPKASTNTSGPARSVSSKMVFSGVRKGLRTDSVCKWKVNDKVSRIWIGLCSNCKFRQPSSELYSFQFASFAIKTSLYILFELKLFLWIQKWNSELWKLQHIRRDLIYNRDD